MALTKVTKSGITNNAIDADKLEDGTILAADITPGTITADKLNSTLDLSSKTVTLPNVSVTNAQLAGSIANAKLANSSLTINGSSVSLGSSISAGALDWQAVITADGSTGTTGVAGRGYFINTTSAAHTFTLPVSAAIGDTIGIVDYAGTFASNKLTIARNGNNIQGVANNSQLGTNRASVTLVYVDATKGWVYANESNVAFLGPLFISATGGTITTSGDFKIHSFTGDGCFVVATLGNPAGGGDDVDYLVVAGGGGGGNRHGGGGGAGGFRTSTAFPVTSQTYPIVIGGGGAGAPNACIAGSAGTQSIFSTITSAGGGGGASSGNCRNGTSGGSGGGAGSGGAVGTGNIPPTSPPQGNNSGGPGTSAGGGGGGAGGAGGTGTSPGGCGVGGSGGPGSPVTSIFGASPQPFYIANSPDRGNTACGVFAGGGGAGANNPSSNKGIGGTGGGGNGNVNNSPGTAGTTNSGGGGGGGGGDSQPGGAGGNGGKGIVLIRYKFQ